MKLKYFGSLPRFQKIVRDCSVFGEWHPLIPAGGYQFRSTAGEVMNWWPSTGTVFFQGRPGPLQRRLITMFVRRAANSKREHIINPRALVG